jgi:hypothetical protein
MADWIDMIENRENQPPLDPRPVIQADPLKPPVTDESHPKFFDLKELLSSAIAL